MDIPQPHKDSKLKIKVLRKGVLISLAKTSIYLRPSIVRSSDFSLAKEDKTEFVVSWPKKWGGKDWEGLTQVKQRAQIINLAPEAPCPEVYAFKILEAKPKEGKEAARIAMLTVINPDA